MDAPAPSRQAGILAMLLAVTAGTCGPYCTAAEVDAALTGHDATAFGFKLHYREAGEGPVVILLHGLGGDGSRWTATMNVLAKDFRVIALDQIGFGASDKPLVNYDHGLLGEFLVEFMKAIGVDKASILGHSMGAFVGMDAAVNHPEMVDRLILLDGGGMENAPRSAHLVQIQNGTTLAQTREYFELMFYDKSRVTDQMVRDNYVRRLNASYTISRMQEARAKNLALLTEEQARGIRAPTLIIWGKQDELLDPSMAGELDRVIPDARVELLDKCGHIPQVEQPERFHQLVYEFLIAE